MDTNYLIRGMLFIVALICMYTDFKERKIYNLITFPAMILGLLLNFVYYGTEGLLSALASMGIAFVFMMVFYLLKQLAEGDVKLVVALCALENVFFIFGSMVIGTTISAFYAIYVYSKTKNRKEKIPFGVFVGLGLILYQFGILCFA